MPRVHQELQPGARFRYSLQQPFHLLQHRRETVVLDQEQQLVLAPEVVVQADRLTPVARLMSRMLVLWKPCSAMTPAAVRRIRASFSS
jgi:hypothetical protein